MKNWNLKNYPFRSLFVSDIRFYIDSKIARRLLNISLVLKHGNFTIRRFILRRFLSTSTDSIWTMQNLVPPDARLHLVGTGVEGKIRFEVLRGGRSRDNDRTTREVKAAIKNDRYHRQICQNRGHRTKETWLTSHCPKWRRFN